MTLLKCFRTFPFLPPAIGPIVTNCSDVHVVRSLQKLAGGLLRPWQTFLVSIIFILQNHKLHYETDACGGLSKGLVKIFEESLIKTSNKQYI